MSNVKQGSARRTVLSIGIAILFVMFVGYSIETFYASPNYEDFCNGRDFVQINSQDECILKNGTWINYSNEIVPKNLENETIPTGYCDFYSICNEEYNSASESYNRVIFFLTLFIGIIIFLIAVSLLSEPVSAGFMGGGVLLIVYGTIRYWGSLSDIWRTIMLGFALAVLVWIGYKKLN